VTLAWIRTGGPARETLLPLFHLVQHRPPATANMAAPMIPEAAASRRMHRGRLTPNMLGSMKALERRSGPLAWRRHDACADSVVGMTKRWTEP
jgi:hypothetical protein